MSSISQCNDNVEKYRLLKMDVISVISKLSLANDDADGLRNDIKNKYQINDNETPIFERAVQLKNNISNTCDFLNNKVIPAIDAAIYNLNNDIAKLEAEQKKAGD